MTTSPDGSGQGPGTNTTGFTDAQRTAMTEAISFALAERERVDRSLGARLRRAAPLVGTGVAAATAASAQGQQAIATGIDGIGRGAVWTGGQIADGAQWAGGQIADGAQWAGEQASNAAEWAGRQWDTGTAWVSQQYNDAVEWAGRVGSEALDWAQQTGANVGNWVVQTGSDIGHGAASIANNAWQMVADYGQHIAANPGQTITTAALAATAVALTRSDVRQAVATAANAGNRWMRNAASAIRHPAESTRKMMAAISANPRVQSALRTVGINPRQTTQAVSKAATGETRTAGEQGRTGQGANFANDPAMAPARGAASGPAAGQTGQAAQTGDGAQRKPGAHRADNPRDGGRS